jgi:hypothetical protein
MPSQSALLPSPSELSKRLNEMPIMPKAELWTALEDVARSIRAEVMLYDFPENINGYSHPIDGEWVISINKNLLELDREITLAHELAHICHQIIEESEADSHAVDAVWNGYSKKLEHLPYQNNDKLSLAVCELILTLLKMLMLCPKMKTVKQKEIAQAFVGILVFIGTSTLIFWLGVNIVKFIYSLVKKPGKK